DEAAGMDRAAKKMIAGKLNGVEGVGGFQNARVVVRVVAVDAEPPAKTEFAGEIEAAGASEVGVEVSAGAERAARGGVEIGGEADKVAKAIVEIGGGEAQAVGGEELVDAGVVGLATLWAKGGIAGETRIATEDCSRAGSL